jgi:hypothetical protein
MFAGLGKYNASNQAQKMDFDEVKRSFDRDCRIGVEPLLVSATVEIFDNRQTWLRDEPNSAE